MSYIKKKSAKQEKRTAKEFSGKTQVASGALWGSKGDVRTGDRGTGFNEDDFLIENKFTDKDYYKLELKIWDKVAQEALKDNFRTPLLQVDIQDLQLVIVSSNDFKVICEQQLGIDVGDVYFGVTDKKSYKLEKIGVLSIFESSKVIDLSFETSKGLRSLIIMKKELFLSR